MKFFFIIIIIFTFVSCNWINPSEETPSFIYVDSFAFSATSDQGTEKQSFVDAWVFVDGEKIGAFELPCSIPILKSGKIDVDLYPGIKLNGISATRAIYPLVTSWQSSVMLVKDSTIQLFPKSEYSSKTIIEQPIEAFEESSISISKTAKSDTIMMRTYNSSEVLEGNYSGLVVLDKNRKFAELKSNIAYDIPIVGTPCFLEINFKTDMPVVIGIISNHGYSSNYLPIVGLNKSSEWKKIYVNLTPTLSREINADNYNYFFQLSLPDDLDEARCYLDNIKLIRGK